jgi:putative tricarboxylic transport membrane protein
MPRCRRTLSALVLLVPTFAPVAAAGPESLRIVAPAAPGGGWDQTARVMQQTIAAERLVPVVSVENVPGAAGTIGLARFIRADRGDAGALLVSGLVMLSAIVMRDAPVSLREVTPIARLVGEYEVVVAPAGGRVRSMADLVAALRAAPGAVSWGGGSAGGSDHLLAGLVAEAAGVDPRAVNYVAFSGGGEALAAVLGGQVTVGVSGYGEFGPHVEAGTLRALAISAPERVAGLDIPTLREQGLDVDLANWRAVVAPPGLTVDQRRELEDLVARMVGSERWRRHLADRGWLDLHLSGSALDEFVEQERERTTAILNRLGLTNAATTPVGGAVFPVLVLIGAAAVAAGWWLMPRAARGAARGGPPVNRRALALVALALALHLLLLERAGFVAAAAALFFVTARAFGAGRIGRDLAASVAVALAVYLGLGFGLGLSLPAGPFGW